MPPCPDTGAHPILPAHGEDLLPLHPTEAKLLRLIRQVGHGTIERISVHDSLPIYVEQVSRKIRLDERVGS